MKIAIEGRIQTGSYTNKDGNKVYTTDVNVNEIEFIERKTEEPQSAPDDFINPAYVDSESLPFK